MDKKSRPIMTYLAFHRWGRQITKMLHVIVKRLDIWFLYFTFPLCLVKNNTKALHVTFMLFMWLLSKDAIMICSACLECVCAHLHNCSASSNHELAFSVISQSMSRSKDH